MQGGNKREEEASKGIHCSDSDVEAGRMTRLIAVLTILAVV